MEKIRCTWCAGSELYQKYHDYEWGTPQYDDRVLFEFLVLEGAQAGLSWITILKKRPGYRQAFDNFDFNKVAKYTDEDVEQLLVNSEIVRNRLKIRSAITNAQCFLQVRAEFGSFSEYLWGFTNGQVIQNNWQRENDIPATSDLSDRLSEDLRKRGFKFVGSTIMYAYLQAVGVINDHVVDCFRYKILCPKES